MPKSDILTTPCFSQTPLLGWHILDLAWGQPSSQKRLLRPNPDLGRNFQWLQGQPARWWCGPRCSNALVAVPPLTLLCAVALDAHDQAAALDVALCYVSAIVVVIPDQPARRAPVGLGLRLHAIVQLRARTLARLTAVFVPSTYGPPLSVTHKNRTYGDEGELTLIPRLNAGRRIVVEVGSWVRTVVLSTQPIAVRGTDCQQAHSIG
jgi:hypothetical protein